MQRRTMSRRGQTHGWIAADRHLCSGAIARRGLSKRAFVSTGSNGCSPRLPLFARFMSTERASPAPRASNFRPRMVPGDVEDDVVASRRLPPRRPARR